MTYPTKKIYYPILNSIRGIVDTICYPIPQFKTLLTRDLKLLVSLFGKIILIQTQPYKFQEKHPIIIKIHEKFKSHFNLTSLLSSETPSPSSSSPARPPTPPPFHVRGCRLLHPTFTQRAQRWRRRPGLRSDARASSGAQTSIKTTAQISS